MLKGKKADISDILLILIMLFFLAVSFLVVAYTTNKFKDVVTETDLNKTTVADEVIDSLDTISTKTIQRGFILIFAILTIGIMISGFLVRIHPAFIFIYIFVLGITIFLAVFLGNTYQKLIVVAELASVASQQTMTNYIMEHIVAIMVGIGALSMVVTFSKVFSRGGYTQVEEL